MAGQSNVPFNDNASASRKFHTWQKSNGTDTVEQYVQVLGEPYLATYTITTTAAISVATANSHLLEIKAGASLRVGLRRLRVSQFANGTTQINQWEILRLTSAGTGGTALTPRPHDPADAAAGATAMTLPGAGTKGTEGVAVWDGAVLTHATVATVGLNPILDIDWVRERGKPLWIASGITNGLTLKNITASASTTVLITAEIVESAEGA